MAFPYRMERRDNDHDTRVIEKNSNENLNLNEFLEAWQFSIFQ